jgi:hypothetical protein
MEITPLLRFRENPQKAKPKVRELAHYKLDEIEYHLEELAILRCQRRRLSDSRILRQGNG